MSVLLPEIAWNLAVWRRLAQLEASLGYCFREKGLLREAPILTMATRIVVLALAILILAPLTKPRRYCTDYGYTHHCHAHHDEAFTHAAYLLTMAIF